MIKVHKKVGNNTVEVEIDEKDPKEEMARMAFWLTPDYCFLCKGSNIVWESNKAKTENGTFTYIKRKCINPECIKQNGGVASSTMGEYKEGGYFWKNWEVYKGNGKVSEEDLGM